MRRLTRAGAALLVIVPLTALVACSSPPADQVPAAAPTEPRAAEEVRLALQASYDLTWGDPRTRHAAEVTAYVRYEEDLAACFAERGAGHVPAPFLDATAPDPGPLSWYDALVPVGSDDGLLVPLQPQATEVLASRRWPGAAPTSADLEACVDGPPAAPAVDPELDDALYLLVTDVLGADAEVVGYADCLAAAGLEGAARDDLVTTVLDRRPAQGPAPDEAVAVAVDGSCRATAFRDAMAALDAPLADFTRRHADRLADLGVQAENVRQQAREDADRMGLAVSWW